MPRRNSSPPRSRYPGHVPPYGRLSVPRRNQFKEFALHSGNLEIQRYNTGLAGYKTFNMEANVERLGDPAATARYTGGGAFVEH